MHVIARADVTKSDAVLERLSMSLKESTKEINILTSVEKIT